MNFFKFKKALSKAWGQDTAYHKDAPFWTPANPALGQCAITALLINEFFGGKIYSGISSGGIVHYWNRIYGVKIDLTKQQFKNQLKFTDVKQWKRDELLLTGNVAERYELLKERTLAAYKKL